MRKRFRTLLSLFIVFVMLVTPAAGLIPAGTATFAEGDAVLFSSSFEPDEPEISGEEIDVQNVIHASYGVKGKGLQVRLETVGGSDDYLGSENKYNLFDGKTGTKFLTGSSTCVVYFALKEPAAVNAYEIASANDEATRDPKSWSFYGSNDGKTWTLLDSRKDITFGGRFVSKEFRFENTAVYEWFKLDVTKNAGAGMTQFASLELYVKGESGDKIQVEESTVTGTASYDDADLLINLFDGNPGTKYLAETPYCDVVFSLKEATVVKAYGITSGNDCPARDPVNFSFYGSADGLTWTRLDEESGVRFAERKSEKIFTLTNSSAYLWFKLEVVANGGPDEFGIDVVQMAELTLYETVPTFQEEPEESVPSTVSSTGMNATAGYEGHPVSYLFDGSVNTKYIVYDSRTATVTFRLESSEVITHYALSNGDDHLERDPKAWKLYGSASGSSWTLLDEKTNETFSGGAKSTNAYAISNSTAYLWYKLEITDVVGPDTWFSSQGNGDVYLIHLSELALFTEENWHEPASQGEEQIDENGPFSVVASSAAGSSVTGTDEGIPKLFDRDEATKACFVGRTAWFSFRVNRADEVTAYAITSANDWPERDPSDWTVYGSNDGENWTAFDVREGVSFSSRYDEKVFRLNEPVSYLWFKVVITKIFGENGYTQLSDFTLMTAEEVPEAIPGADAVKDFGPTATENGKPGAWTGLGCLAVYGEQSATENTLARIALFENLNIPVSADTTLSYVIFPGLFNSNAYDYEYTSCRVILDLHFTDGSVLSGLGVRDQNGSVLSPAGQVEGECLVTGQWHYVECRIGEAASGKTVDRVDAYFEMASAEDASKFITFFDDLKIENKAEIVYEHLSDYITILRGTNNDQAYSRGLCTPAVTMPNGFNFYSPVTNPAKATASYNYQQNGNNNPLDSITVIHAPSYWLSSYGTWQFMPNTSVNTGTAPTSAKISSDARKSKFSHENEIARAHYYSVLLDEGTPASGVKIEVTPTSHAAYVRFTFPADAENVNVIFDSLWGTGKMTFNTSDSKSFTGYTNHNSAGSTRMYICGEFDTQYSYSKVVATKKGIVSFPSGTTVVTMKIATSFISASQAQHNLDLEIGNLTFDGVLNAAQGEWDALCGKFEIEGASYTELVNFYSSLYRMYAYPNLYSENEGTNEQPVWVYSSPYSGEKTSGFLYTNNGFWDTYRTTWAGYSLFTADKDGEMLDGIVQHYIDSGWIPRWICPGGVNCMVGTSSDIIFADAYIKGIDFNYEKAWESMVENASAYSANMSAGGRPVNNVMPYLGYVPNNDGSSIRGEAYSSSMEGYINDYGLYRMAEKMGLKDEAEYYLNRCLKYPEMFNAEADFFMGKSDAGVFSANAQNYDPAGWGGPKGDYTESVGWVNAFPAVFDPEGLVALYGGREALAAKLNVMFDDSIESMRRVVNIPGHEMREFKEVKMGQYEHNNQPSHHVIYTYAFSSEPWHVQEYTREVLRHVYVGSEIGQGFPGDEDNGEMSAWFVFNALGFYPYCLASGEYIIGSPLFDKVTVHLDNGNDIVIIARSNSQENVYIQSAKVNGEDYDKMYLTHELLTAGCTIEYEMGSEPSAFGTSEEARPGSISSASKVREYEKDLSDGAEILSSPFTVSEISDERKVFTDVSSASNLFDQNSRTGAAVTDGATVVLAGGGFADVSMVTLSSDTKSTAPTSIRVEVSNDGEHWITVLEKEDIAFLFDNFVQPFAIPENMRSSSRCVRITLGGGTASEIEVIGSEHTLDITDVTELLNFLSMSAERQAEAGYQSVIISDFTSAPSIQDVTTLLNFLSGGGD